MPIPYFVAFVFAILRRNWGRVALLEASATNDAIERTSTATLLQLMAIAGLACAVALFWSKSFDASLMLSTIIATTVGITIVATSAGYFKLALDRRSSQWTFLLLIVFSFGVLNSGIVLIEHGRYQNRAQRLLLDSLDWTQPHVPMAIISGFLASLWFSMYLILCSWWLRICGWRPVVSS